MGKNKLSPEIWEVLEDVCAFRFQQLLRVIPMLVPSIDVEKYKDRFLLFEATLTVLRDGSSPQRLAARCLLYIKQHVSLLRHKQPQGKGLSVRDCTLVLDNFCDLLQALNELRAEECLNVAKNMAVDYYQKCVECNVHLPVIRPPLAGILELDTPEDVTLPATFPPKEQTMDWYKTHGWRSFFRPGQTITFLTGRYPNQPCDIECINGNNVRCIFADGPHCISTNVPLTWED